ncbi:beta strand repeat-containing protein, partial [Nanoarchaeota archaeon]
SGWSDADGDSAQYYYTWYDGASVVTGQTSSTFNCSRVANCDKGDTITCQVTPYDGESNGTSINGSEVIENTPPIIGTPTVNNTAPYTNHIIKCLNGSFSDIDNDSPTWYYRWYDTSVLISGQFTSTLNLSISGLDKADNITCSVISSDGEVNASAWKNSSNYAIIQNSIPSIIAVNVTPDAPNTTSLLTCTPSGWSDDDGDSEQYVYTWFDTGSLVAGQTSSTFDCNSVAGCTKNDNITCQATPYDGEANGIAINGSEVIENIAVVITLIPNQTVNNSITWSYDANASDVDVDEGIDTLTWYDNTSLFDINSSTGVISDTPLEAEAGSYTILINVSDGTIQDTRVFTYTINDVGIPSINLVSPTTASGNLSQNYILMNVTAVDVNLANITAYLYNATNLVNSTLSFTSPLFVNFSNLADGTYYFNATVYDSAINFNKTETRIVILDTGKPAVDLISPDNNLYTTSTSINFIWNVTNGIDPILDCNLTIDSVVNASVASSSGVATSYNVSGFTDGVHYWNVTCVDDSSNVNVSETRSFTIDTINPLIQFVSPTTASGNHSQNYIEANISITDNNLANITVYLYNGTSLVYRNTSLTSPYYINYAGLSEGTYSYNATVYDSAGNYNSTETRVVTLDVTKPVVVLNFPPNAHSTTSSSINFNYTATNGIDPILDCDLIIDSIINASIPSPSGQATNYTVSNITEGTHYWNVSCEDDSGNVNISETRSFNIDYSAPVISNVSTIPASPIIDDGTGQNITVNFTSDEYPINVTFTSYNSTGIVNTSGPVQVNNASELPLTYILPSLADGNYTLNLSAVDSLNNSAEYYVAMITVADVITPSVTDILPAQNTSANVNTIVTISANVTDLSGLSSVIANITLPNLTITQLQLTDQGNDIFSANYTPNISGQYNITIIATDTKGNVNATVTTYFTATTLPVIVDTSVTPLARAVLQNVTITANVTDDIGVDAVLANITLSNGTVQQLPLANIGGDTYQGIYTSPNLTGAYNVIIIANDTASNIVTAVAESFNIGPLFVWTGNVVDSNNTGLNSSIEIFYADTTVELDAKATGLYLEYISTFLYDILYKAYDGRIQVLLRSVNLSSNNNETLGLERIAPSGEYLVVYAIENMNYSFTNATVIISYANTSYSDENSLILQVCEDWEFNSSVCTSGWTALSGVQDTNADTFTFARTAFSAFGIKEETVTPTGGGRRRCSEKWLCHSYGRCINGNKTRKCYDLNNCGTIRYKPNVTESCEICEENWECTDYGDCIENERKRTCKDLNNCGTFISKPEVTQECIVKCVEKWECGKWSNCTDSKQTRACWDENRCDTFVEIPTKEKKCVEKEIVIPKLIPTPSKCIALLILFILTMIVCAVLMSAKFINKIRELIEVIYIIGFVGAIISIICILANCIYLLILFFLLQIICVFLLKFRRIRSKVAPLHLSGYMVIIGTILSVICELIRVGTHTNAICKYADN